MGNSLKFLLLAVSVIIVALLITFGLMIYRQSSSISDTGLAMLTESTNQLSEADLTQYDGRITDGAQVISTIKSHWVPTNPLAICVSTKDGKVIMYDYDGNVFSLVSSDGLQQFPSKKGNGDTWSNSAVICAKQSDAEDATGKPTFSKKTGYNENVPIGKEGYINRNDTFAGSIQRDANENIRCITFVQR